MDCPHYPCHDNMEDCTFCYCPLYPCKDESLGKWYKGVWDCSDCEKVHTKEFVEEFKRSKNERI